MAACVGGNYEIAHILLESGASISSKTKAGRTALELCFVRLDEDSNKYENKNLCLKLAELLLQYGADIDAVDDGGEGTTLLMQFCSISIELSPFQSEVNLEVIQFLLEHGADRSKKNVREETAWMLAGKHSQRDEVRRLLEEVKQKYFHPNEKAIADANKAGNGIKIESSGVNCGCFTCYK